MKFRFYIVDLMEDKLVGTNDEAVAKYFADSEDCFVVNAEEGYWLQSGKINSDVQAVDPIDFHN